MSDKVKFLTIEFSNGDRFKIDAETIAEDRADYYRELARERSDEDPTEVYQNEVEFALSNEFELRDWMQGNMNWDEIEPLAEKVHDAEPSYKTEWPNVDIDTVT